jgi:hypothetical protein
MSTPDPEIRRVDIRIFAGEAKDSVASLSGFAGATISP